VLDFTADQARRAVMPRTDKAARFRSITIEGDVFLRHLCELGALLHDVEDIGVGVDVVDAVRVGLEDFIKVALGVVELYPPIVSRDA
jgi:hypothetical protein